MYFWIFDCVHWLAVRSCRLYQQAKVIIMYSWNLLLVNSGFFDIGMYQFLPWLENHCRGTQSGKSIIKNLGLLGEEVISGSCHVEISTQGQRECFLHKCRTLFSHLQSQKKWRNINLKLHKLATLLKRRCLFDNNTTHRQLSGIYGRVEISFSDYKTYTPY